MNMKLDSGSLESLNSMIRQAINISNNTNISLELLSARVNTRKTITTAASGSNKLRDVKPIATELAASCLLYQDQATGVLDDTYRWAPPQPATGQYAPGRPEVYDPESGLTKQQRWAFKFHRNLMKSLCIFSKDNLLVGFTLSVVEPKASSVDMPEFSETYVVAELTKRLCQLHKIVLSTDRAVGDGVKACIESPFKFLNSLDVLANLQPLAKRYKPGIKWELVRINYADRIPELPISPDVAFTLMEENRIQLSLVGSGETQHIKYRKEYTKKQIVNSVASHTGDRGHGDGAHDVDALLDREAVESTRDDVSDASMDSLDSVQANEELLLLEQALRGDYSDDDNDDDNERSNKPTTTDSTDGGGESCEMNGEQHLLSADEHADIVDMQDTNNRLLAAAASLQEQDGFCNLESVEIPDDVRPYEDEVGETIFSDYINMNQRNIASNDSAPAKRLRRTHTPALSPAALQIAFDKWTSATQVSATTCEQICSLCDRFDVHHVASCLGHELSLVLHEGSSETLVASLVSWTTPYAKLVGRSVKLDADDCVIYPSHFVEKVVFSPSVMIWPTSGARVRKQSREQVPYPVLRARDMVETAADGLFNGTCLELGASIACAGCRKSEGDGLNDLPLRKCAFCLLHWHHDCAEQLANRLPALIRTHGTQRLDRLTLTTMPFIFWCLG
jgi:hypothetical protein